MKLQVREQTLDIWRALVAHTYRDGQWHWGGRSGSNSISDAEQLLCLLFPAANVPALRLDDPDETAGDVLQALRGLGSHFDLLRVLISAIREYMERYRDEEGNPTFAGGSYLVSDDQEANPGTTQEQFDLDIVDSFSMSITLCLSALGFMQTLRSKMRSKTMQVELDEVERLTSDRLTAAQVGLLRSFSVNVFDIDSSEGRILCRTVNQTHEPDRVVAERLARSIKDIRGSLREELSLGSGQASEALQDPLVLFECGWSWGVVKDAPEIDGVKVESQRPGVAQDRPYLYFTTVALDGIEDLFSERTRVLGLLTDEQQRLATALQLRWDLCTQFWRRVATFGTGQWPLEDVPWRTTDNVESDHFSLLVASMLIHNLHVHGTKSVHAGRLGRLLEDLAHRGRITRRPLRGHDPNLAVHAPGTTLRLTGSELLGPLQKWMVSSYSSLLLKRSVQLIGLTTTTEDREKLIYLADKIWEHLLKRRLTDRLSEGLWDQPAVVMPDDTTTWHTQPSWYHTQRICECLVAAASLVESPVPVSPQLVSLASEFLSEAEHLFDLELLNGTWASVNDGMRHRGGQAIAARLERARELVSQRPGTAAVLAQEVLSDLDELAKARTQYIGQTQL